MGCETPIKLPTKEVYMCASLEEKERELIVVLLPSHEPVRLDVTLPVSG